MDLSVCITVKNRSRVAGPTNFLYPFPECVRAVCKAVKGLDAELVVVDWGSTDWPLTEWLDKASGDVPVQLVRLQGDFCLGAGRNIAAQNATGAVLFFLDADTLTDRRVIREGLKAVAAGKAFFPVCSYYSTAGSQKAAWAFRGYGNCMVSKEMFAKIGSWPVIPTDSEDTLFHARTKELFEVARPKLEGLVHPWHPGSHARVFADWAVEKGWITSEQRKLAAENSRSRGGCSTQTLLDLGQLRAEDWVHGKRCRFAFVADVPGWALHRAGDAIGKYHNTRHVWDMYHATSLQPVPEGYDVIRVGATPLATELVRRGSLPQTKLIVSVASWRDATGPWRPQLVAMLDRIAAFAVLDRRLFSHVAAFGKPILYTPDRCDYAVFYPMPELRPISGPLRVGWTGSEAVWGNQKHVVEITAACAAAGVLFVRQDRELDGALDTVQLREWYNTLDGYISANDVTTLTPVTSLEAVGCGLPVLTTRCGELWPLLGTYAPEWLIEASTVEAITAALVRFAATGRASAQRMGAEFRARYAHFVDWQYEAPVVMADMVALALCTV